MRMSPMNAILIIIIIITICFSVNWSISRTIRTPHSVYISSHTWGRRNDRLVIKRSRLCVAINADEPGRDVLHSLPVASVGCWMGACSTCARFNSVQCGGSRSATCVRLDPISEAISWPGRCCRSHIAAAASVCVFVCASSSYALLMPWPSYECEPQMRVCTWKVIIIVRRCWGSDAFAFSWVVWDKPDRSSLYRFFLFSSLFVFVYVTIRLSTCEVSHTFHIIFTIVRRHRKCD